jgi:UDP-N-acetylglucosamine--N-acetylmuramyl-(pentapeptide) pyrophosphoryl-undecaprenol N-acetylglucosamine transferase
MQHSQPKPLVAIACGGTGGHLFPGRAVGDELLARGCAVTLLVSPKEVDQQAAQACAGLDVLTLPAVGFSWSKPGLFLRGAWQAFAVARRAFRRRPPRAVLAMGGYTSAPPVLAAKWAGAATFLHESNSLPGRANRWLAGLVDQAFVGFPQAASRLRARSVEVIGTPVRMEFQPGSTAAARMAMGLDARRPVLLVTGGSQGASAINELLVGSLPLFKQLLPELQFLHLTGSKDFERVRAAYQSASLRAVVRPFLTEMELALDAATVAVSRAGASSMAELAAMRLPAILIPYPWAADNHQFHNARAFVETGAARMLVQAQAVPELFTRMVADLLSDQARREDMKRALAQWHRPEAAARLAERILRRVDLPAGRAAALGEEPAFPPRTATSSLHS